MDDLFTFIKVPVNRNLILHECDSGGLILKEGEYVFKVCGFMARRFCEIDFYMACHICGKYVLSPIYGCKLGTPIMLDSYTTFEIKTDKEMEIYMHGYLRRSE